MRNAARITIPVIVPRAVVVWGLTRLLFAVLPMAIGEPFASISPSPIAVVFFAGFVGLVDVRVRGERILWANLAVTPLALYAVYAAATIPAECLLAFTLR